MFKKIFEWVKTHKLIVFLVFLFFSYRFIASVLFSIVGSADVPVGRNTRSEYLSDSYEKASVSSSPIVGSVSQRSPSIDLFGSSGDSVKQVAQEDRKVITNSNLSLHVKNVDDAVDSIRQNVITMGGFMVNTSIKRDEAASSATLEVRVPSEQLVEFSKYLRGIAVKVVYENINGRDITDQYTDYEERLTSLESVKERFEEIMDEAETVDEIMRVQNQIFNIQNQIDSIKGQLTYMDRSTATSKVTIMLSTDDMSLPYTPVKSWRLEVVFKEAIRSLTSTFQSIGTLAIWILVFLPLILFVAALKISVSYLYRNRKRREKVKDIK
jgi:hypothetical protein